jgi:antitoxin (DNA-binding transcriptional repressor) of toxin-antitoxin stability system
MRAVGIRELKNRLSEYIRLVRGGEEVLVAHRGEVVAELRPPRPLVVERTNAPGIDALVRRGLLTTGAPNDPDAYPDLPSLMKTGRVEELLDQERGQR